MAYRLLDHTADLLLEADGASREEALLHAARGLVRVVTGHDPPARSELEVRFTLEAPDLGSLAVTFLSELLWILESKGTLWLGGGVVLEVGDGVIRLDAAGNGASYDPATHGRGIEVKAVTYHALEFAPHGASWRLRVVLDI